MCGWARLSLCSGVLNFFSVDSYGADFYFSQTASLQKQIVVRTDSWDSFSWEPNLEQRGLKYVLQRFFFHNVLPVLQVGFWGEQGTG